jgi:hypothetical protein
MARREETCKSCIVFGIQIGMNWIQIEIDKYSKESKK